MKYFCGSGIGVSFVGPCFYRKARKIRDSTHFPQKHRLLSSLSAFLFSLSIYITF